MSDALAHTDINAQRLEALIEELTEIHEQLLELTFEHREAVRLAQSEEIAACVRRQRELIERIGFLDSQRRALIEEMLPGVPAREVTLTNLARMLAGPARDRIEAAATRLRELIGAIASENKAVGEATSVLLGHMDGMVRQFATTLSKSGTYGRCGSVRTDTRIASGIDLCH